MLKTVMMQVKGIRTLIQVVLLISISMSFDANSTLLHTDDKCVYIATIFKYTSKVYLFTGIFAILPLIFLAKGLLAQHIEGNPTNLPDSVRAPKVPLFLNNLSSELFFLILSLGVIITDGIIESALAGLLTISLFYSLLRVKADAETAKWRAVEILTVVIVILIGEIALNFFFGKVPEFRASAQIFDSSTPTKLIGYGTFSTAFAVIICENLKCLQTAMGILSK